MHSFAAARTLDEYPRGARRWLLLALTVIATLLVSYEFQLAPILSLLLPKQAKYIPSAAGVGLAWVFQWYYAVLFFLGALVGYYFEKRHPKAAEDYTFPVASGVIAGESLMGVVVSLLGASGIMR